MIFLCIGTIQYLYKSIKIDFCMDENEVSTLIFRTSSAVALATSFADCTQFLRAIGFVVFDDASREILHKVDVCFAMVVAKVKI
jgi:hypothetical protein